VRREAMQSRASYSPTPSPRLADHIEKLAIACVDSGSYVYSLACSMQCRLPLRKKKGRVASFGGLCLLRGDERREEAPPCMLDCFASSTVGCTQSAWRVTT